MQEKRIIAVGSFGEAEVQSLSPKNQVTALRVGNIAIPLGETPLTPEQVGNSEYFVEPGGRVIDTKTGNIVDNGDGRIDGHVKIPHEAIQHYEENSK